MTSPPPAPAGPEQTLAEQFKELRGRVERLERTLAAVASEAAGVSVAGPCGKCGRSLLLVKEGSLTCPCCSYTRSI